MLRLARSSDNLTSRILWTGTDAGHTWQHRSQIDTTPQMFRGATGLDESDMIALADGCLLVVSRTGSVSPKQFRSSSEN